MGEWLHCLLELDYHGQQIRLSTELPPTPNEPTGVEG
jgi:hypothetical protein